MPFLIVLVILFTPIQESDFSQINEWGHVHNAEQAGSPPDPPAGLPLGDPDLEPGFPVQALHTAGMYHGGPAVHTLVANIDSDPTLEIIATALANGPLYAWNADGSLMPGWPVTAGGYAGYPAAGNLVTTGDSMPALQVFVGYWGQPGYGDPGKLVAYNSGGISLPGWPRNSASYVTTPPALADVDGDSLDEIFVGEEDWKLHAYRADGSILAGWPVSGSGGQERHTPAIADLDGDGDLEIVFASGSTTPGVYLYAYHHTGTPVAGFPVLFPNYGFPDTFPAIGDVDGDGNLEIIVVARDPGTAVRIISAGGQIEQVMQAAGSAPYGTAPALADLDGDFFPEIIVQTDSAISIWKGDGSPLPGWPVTWNGYWKGSSAPVVGDVDGDHLMDIVVTSQLAGSSTNGQVRVYNHLGQMHPHFPKNLNLGGGAVPAIADIDRDGRNEIIVTGSYWNGHSGFYDKVWVYDLGGQPNGRIEWGQFGRDSRHQGYYPPFLPTSWLYLPAIRRQ